MPVRLSILAFVLIFAATAGSAWASLSLKSTMRSWKADAATIDRMLIGSGAVDAAEASRILQGLSDDAQSIANRVTGTSAQARDVKVRFEKFAGDARSALAGAASRDKLKATYAQLRADCRSCHDVYAN